MSSLFLFRLSLLVALLATGSLIGLSAYADFYVRGTDLCDSGVFGGLLSRTDATLQVPLAVWDDSTTSNTSHCWLQGASFYATHVSPVLVVAAALISGISLDAPVALGLFQGACHALLVAVIVAYHLPQPSAGTERWAVLGAALAVAGATTAVMVSAAPHYELLVAIVMVGYLGALVKGQKRHLLLWIGLGVLVREDAVFHLAGLHACWSLACVLDKTMPWRHVVRGTLVAIGLIGLGWVVLKVQRFMYPAEGAFARVYSGVPAYEHLDLATAWSRVAVLWTDRADVGLIFLVSIVLAIALRSWRLLAPMVSVLPWTALQLTAFAPAPASLFTYYAFPWIMVMASWGIVAFGLRVSYGTRKRVAVLTLVVCLLSLAAFRAYPGMVIERLTKFPDAQSVALQHALLREAAKGESLEGLVVLDPSAAAVIPWEVPRSRVTPVPASTIREASHLVAAPGRATGKAAMSAFADEGLMLEAVRAEGPFTLFRVSRKATTP
jgi:hypothetical protein